MSGKTVIKIKLNELLDIQGSANQMLGYGIDDDRIKEGIEYIAKLSGEVLKRGDVFTPEPELSKERKELAVQRKTLDEGWKDLFIQTEKTKTFVNYILSQKDKDMIKAFIFVRHIEGHLSDETKIEPGAKVLCKTCNKTIDEIFKEDIGFKFE